MKKLILLLILCAVGVASGANDTIKTTGKWSALTWSTGSAPGTSDAVFKSVDALNDSMNANYEIVSFKCDTLISGIHTRIGKFLTLTGAAGYNYLGSGITNMGDSVKFTGTNADFHISSAAGTVTASQTKIIWSGTGGTVRMEKNPIYRQWKIDSSSGLTVSSGGLSIRPTGDPALIIKNGGSFTYNAGTVAAFSFNSATVASLFSFDPSYTFNGTGGINIISIYTSGVAALTVPAWTYTGSGIVQIISTGTNQDATYTLGGNLDLGTAAFYNASASTTADIIFDANGYRIKAGEFRMGGNNTGNYTLNLDSASHRFTIWAGGTYNGASCVTTINFESSKDSISGNHQFGSTHVVNAGTSLIVHDGTGKTSFTTANKTIYDLKILKTGSGVDSLTTDSLKLHTFTEASGIFKQNSKAIVASGNISIIGSGASAYNGVINVDSSFTVSNNAADFVGSKIVIKKKSTLTSSNQLDSLEIASGSDTVTLGSNIQCNVYTLTSGTVNLNGYEIVEDTSVGVNITITGKDSISISRSVDTLIINSVTDTVKLLDSVSYHNIWVKSGILNMNGRRIQTITTQRYGQATGDSATIIYGGNMIITRDGSLIFDSTSRTGVTSYLPNDTAAAGQGNLLNTNVFLKGNDTIALRRTMNVFIKNLDVAYSGKIVLHKSTATFNYLFLHDGVLTGHGGILVLNNRIFTRSFTQTNPIVLGGMSISGNTSGYIYMQSFRNITVNVPALNLTGAYWHFTGHSDNGSTTCNLQGALTCGNFGFRVDRTSDLIVRTNGNRITRTNAGDKTYIEKLSSVKSTQVDFICNAGDSLSIDTLKYAGSSDSIAMNFSSATPGSPFYLTTQDSAKFISFTDVFAVDSIYADSTSYDGGGNTNINFPTACTAPSVITHPASTSTTVPDSVCFYVSATGDAPLSYQWQRNSVDVSGATASSYTTPPTTSADNSTTYRAIVSNSCGSDTSNEATLSLVPVINSIAPVWQKRGLIFKVRGFGFNATQGDGTLYLGISDLLGAASWSDSLITDTIPASWSPRGTYNVIVKTSGNLRDTSQIRVLIPTITPMTP